MPSVADASMDAKGNSNVMVNHYEHAEVHLSLGTVKVIVMQSNDPLCITILKLINEKKFSFPQGYFESDEKPLHKVMRGDDKSIHALAVCDPSSNMFYIKYMMLWVIMLLLGHINMLNTCST